MSINQSRALLARILADLGDDERLLEAVAEPPGVVPLPSTLPVGILAQASVDAAAVEAAAIIEAKSGALPRVASDPRRIAAAYSSERVFRFDGDAPGVWAPFSGFWRAGDGWVRTHGNYPHHAARLLAGLGLAPDADANAVRTRIAASSAADVAARIDAAGGIAVVVARADPEGLAAAASNPILDTTVLGTAPPRSWGVGTLPLSGIRVLDLTRVIAGPVATRTLALFGADVLRIDSPRLPEIEWQHLDGGAGKRTALLDLGERSDRRRFEELLVSADVVVQGYRPAALDRLGLSPSQLAAAHPGIVVGRLSAWGFEGEAAERRGFDSIVQAASGISWLESADGGSPGALPAQALDHSAGYLLAAGILSALRRQRDAGGSHLVSTTLARVAAELLTLPPEARVDADTGLDDQTQVFRTAVGSVRTVRPAPQYEGSPTTFPAGPHPWGSDAPEWLVR